MKQQVARFSPHQNGKVFAVLMAVSSLVFLLPFLLISGFTGGGPKGPSMLMLLLFPVLYLVLGYLTVLIGCLLYNFMVPHIGGIEYELRATDA